LEGLTSRRTRGVKAALNERRRALNPTVFHSNWSWFRNNGSQDLEFMIIGRPSQAS
jgi:hypothetical protein